MSSNEISASAEIEAAAELIYTVIADYRNHHPHILPEAYFNGLEVLEGGFGAGTRINVFANVLGSEQTLTMGVAEPQPGRVLTEEDLNTGIKTTFTLQPQSDTTTRVTLTTTWGASSGLRGLFERFFYPRYVRGLLQAELVQMADYLAEVEL